MLFLPDVTKRVRQPEIMDEPGLDEKLHHGALKGLKRINFWSGSAGILWPALRDMARASAGPLRVLDVATGAGDLPIRLWHKARTAGLALDMAGCDVSPTAVRFAQRQAETRKAKIHFFAWDALTGDLPTGYDALVCSLFLHHLDEEQAAMLLRRMGAVAQRGVLVNDLVRGRRGYLLAWLGARILSRSHVVHVDGPRSVAAAFTVKEALELAERAGLVGAQISKRWPCRFLLRWQHSRD
jgi:2-polyprenyl-3-methyl-5-hydroxy-6-metoxy-1,4-benzoquinol methylase